GNELATLNHQGTVRAVTFGLDSKTIATASNDNTARLWDTENGKQLATLNHQQSVNAVAFSPDGKTIATASWDTHLWDTDTGKELATLNHQSSVNAVAFSPDGKTIATASYGNTARLWDTENGKQLATLSHQEQVNAVAFSSDGKTIATASDDNTARLHRVMIEDLIQEACDRLSRNLTAKEWQQYINSDLETYQKTCENLPVHPSVTAEAALTSSDQTPWFDL
ncbi:MAG: WD40 repeat domain-containing protein, partial [Trichodesmium sp. St5_bin8]|nr:WD40 repeat domain-containing protein [Trichodesmium sp. St5_bin8]